MSDDNYEERLKTTGRNDRCPCGSGKKYKKCHLSEDQDKHSAALKALEEQAKAKAAEKAEAEDAEAEAEAETSTTDKRKRSTVRNKGQSGGKPQAAATKAKNMPRRGAV